MLLLVGAAAALAPDESHAVSIEKLLMPGKVAEGHAEFEGECSSCHGDSERPSGELCLDCHENVGSDIELNLGFHGKFPAASGDCVNCHTDHEGRDADIVGLDPNVFDHKFTDFLLIGAHQAAACSDCHQPQIAFHDAPNTCNGCHQADDVHRGGLGPECDSCHTQASWAEAKFDHATTGYPLTGGHRDAQCTDCHAGQQFDNTPTQCYACHAIDDVHNGSNGTQCQDCHNTANWGQLAFDHFAQTGFALVDGHGGLQCTDCHVREDFKDELDDGACTACHLSEDEHQGRNGTECNSCHQVSSWPVVKFDHAVDTTFALTGKHEELVCSTCHKESTDTPLPSDCAGCHAVQSPHGESLDKGCETCHATDSWSAASAFDHDLTGFPLTGLHAAAPCESCHESHQFLEASDQCVDCHGETDPHEGKLGNQCSDCHNSNDWLFWVFDHSAETGFPLDGSHSNLSCTACHTEPGPTVAELTSTCASCHRQDDVHAGSFDANCGRCHTTRSFADVESL